MKQKTDNPIPVKTRLKELIGDWLFRLPLFTEAQSQRIAFSTSVLPLTIIFARLDYRKGSFAKRWASLQLVYKHRNFAHSLLRSAIKLFPW